MQPQSSYAYYDKIYSFKDYKTEVEKLLTFMPAEFRTGKTTMLDVACGTGGHLKYLKKHFDVQGLDISPEYLTAARQKFPKIKFHQADMCDFELHQTFDVITCLFSSIGYVRTLENLQKAVACFYKHLNTPGLLILEPWFIPAQWKPNRTYAVLSDEPELKIARVNTSFQKDKISWFDMHFLIGTPEGTEHFVEHHELGLFEIEEILKVLSETGFSAQYDEEGITGRGLYVGEKK